MSKFKLALVFTLTVLMALSPMVARAFTNDESATTVVGQSLLTTGGGGDSNTQQEGPTGITFDSSGNMWVADYSNNRVLEYPAPITTGEAASIVLGQAGFGTNSCSDANTGLCEPISVAFDSSGNLWVADAANGRVVEFTTPFTTGEAASLVLGQAGFGTNGVGDSATQMDRPYSVAFDSTGNLWVAESGNNRVIEFVKGAGFTDGEAASLVLGQTGFGLDAAATTATGLAFPAGMAFDSGNLWVADLDNNRVVEFTSPFSTGETESIVIGQSLFTTGDPALTQTGLSEPAEIAFDHAGNLWVPEYGPNNRVTEFTAPFSDGEAASGVLGQTSYTTSRAGTNATDFADGVWAIGIDSSNNIWAADFSNNRVLGFAGGPFSAIVPPTPLPLVIAKHLTFNFQGAPSIVGNLATQFGGALVYNVPGFNPSVDLFANTFSACINSGQGTITVAGFTNMLTGPNATEFTVYNWYSTTTSAQGWPKEPSC